MLRLVSTVFAALVLGAPISALAADPRAEIVSAVTLSEPASLAGAQVSDMRGTGGPEIGDAMACLRLGGGAPVYIAVFFEAGRVINYRRAVMLDRCETLAYSPLQVAPAVAVRKSPGRRSGEPKIATPATTSRKAAAAIE